MADILLSGFTPFDGRAHNASWIAARQLAQQPSNAQRLQCLEIPVCWGEAARLLTAAVARSHPRCIIAMGEGAVGRFTIETLAHNARQPRPDNQQCLPEHPLIDPAGPASFSSSAPVAQIRAALQAQGIAVELSAKAGGFLCEEALYTLERLKAQHADIALVLFVHLPPFGSPVVYRGVSRTCDEALLADFGAALLHSTLFCLNGTEADSAF